MELIVVTNRPDLARWAEAAGVERVLIDLEHRGKEERQRGRGTFVSSHTLDDAAALADCLERTVVEVRLDAWYDRSPAQVDDVLTAGAGVVMLPMTESVEAVHRLVETVAGRARVALLVETMPGLAVLDDLVDVPGVAEVHIGLTDLMLSRGGHLPFEPLADRSLAEPARTVRVAGLGFGVGGVSAPRTRGLPIEADVVLGAVVELGATMGWLGRSFLGLGIDDAGAMATGVAEVRQAVARWSAASGAEFEANRLRLAEQVVAAVG